MGLAMRRRRRDRLFHYITAAVVFVAAIAYFTMGSNLGFTPIAVEYQRSNPKVSGRFREIFYVRYIDWVITTPLLLTDLMLTAGMPWPTIFFVIMVDEMMIITGLIGALVQSVYKWGFFTFGMYQLRLSTNFIANISQAASPLSTSHITSSGNPAATPPVSEQTSTAPSSCAAP